MSYVNWLSRAINHNESDKKKPPSFLLYDIPQDDFSPEGEAERETERAIKKDGETERENHCERFFNINSNTKKLEQWIQQSCLYFNLTVFSQGVRLTFLRCTPPPCQTG